MGCPEEKMRPWLVGGSLQVIAMLSTAWMALNEEDKKKKKS